MGSISKQVRGYNLREAKVKSRIQAIILVLTGFIMGVFFLRYVWPPFIQSIVKKKEDFKSNPIFTQISPGYLQNDVETLISIHNSEDVKLKRQQLIDVLWGNSGLPLSKMPEEVIVDYKDARYDDLYDGPLQRIDKIVVRMENGLESQVYLFVPEQGNGQFVIYHQGHDEDHQEYPGDFISGKGIIFRLLKSGFTVAGFSMPLLGLNNRPFIEDARIGKLRITSHDQMAWLPCPEGHAVKYFVEPVIVFLNHVTEKSGGTQVHMIGKSGGGWTTLIAAALDDRIKRSFSVAGSYPIYLRSESERDWGDYEQHVPEIYKTCNYLELYILGSFGEGRHHLQLVNQYDSCCFAGIKWQAYEPFVRKRVSQLGSGRFDVILDNSHTDHKISPVIEDLIIRELNKD